MRKYTNNIKINGEVFTHTVEAESYMEAVKINRCRKENAARRGRKIFGRLVIKD
jgi:hypothetical protein